MQQSWKIHKAAPEQLVSELSRTLGVSPVTARLLCNYNITSQEEANRFIYPQLDQLHDPMLLAGMDKAVARLLLAHHRQENIVVFGDFDADGVTSTALLITFLRRNGFHAQPYIPHRVKEGYGLSTTAISKLKAADCNLIVTVDCGINSVAECRFAAELGLDIIVTDHHTPAPELPQAVALINPKLVPAGSTPYPNRNLAGVGVALKLVQAMLQELDKSPDEILTYLDLAALGTIGDLVPLCGENRAIASLGITQIKSGQTSPGIKALLEACKIAPTAVSGEKISFGLIPKINATGRLKSANIALELLTCADYARCQEISLQMIEINSERQEMVINAHSQARQLHLDDPDIAAKKIVIVASDDWHPGIIGLVAAKLVDEFSLPAIAFTSNYEGEGFKASARSLGSFDLYQAISACSRHLTRFGGHAMAAGLSLTAEALSVFSAEINEYCRKKIDGASIASPHLIDMRSDPADLCLQLAEELALLEPFGNGHPPPVFLLSKLSLCNYPALLRERHLKMQLSPENASSRFEVIGFNMSNVYNTICSCANPELDIIFTPQVNSWQGRSSLQLLLKDIRVKQVNPL